MLVIAEVKEIVSARYGYWSLLKHVPDQAFAMDESLYRSLGRRYETELALWGASDGLHMVMIATMSVDAKGIPLISEMSLMTVNAQWLPVESAFDSQLINTLVYEGRAFKRGMRYGLPLDKVLACAILTDISASPIPLYVLSAAEELNAAPLDLNASPSTWVWPTSRGRMPPLPQKAVLAVCHASILKAEHVAARATMTSSDLARLMPT